MIEIEHDKANCFTMVRVSGVLTAHDYKLAVPELEHALELAGTPMRLLLRLEDFRGWELEALWQELKFDLRHRDDEGRIAVIGDSKIEEWVTRLVARFATAEIRFFPFAQEQEAGRWLRAARA